VSLVYVLSEEVPLIDDMGDLVGLFAIKVGFTSDSVSKRISQLQTGNHRALNPVMVFDFKSHEMGRQMEKLIHFNLANKRMSGEWFRFDASVAKLLHIIGYLAPDFEDYGVPESAFGETTNG
jgi:hypothetical protein